MTFYVHGFNNFAPHRETQIMNFSSFVGLIVSLRKFGKINLDSKIMIIVIIMLTAFCLKMQNMGRQKQEVGSLLGHFAQNTFLFFNSDDVGKTQINQL